MFLMKNWIILADEDIRIFSYEWLWGVSKASRKRWWLFWVWNTRRFHCQGFSIDEPEHQRRRDICQLWTPWCPNSTSSSTFEPATTEVSVSWTVGAINVVRLRKDTGHFLEVESVSVFWPTICSVFHKWNLAVQTSAVLQIQASFREKLNNALNMH